MTEQEINFNLIFTPRHTEAPHLQITMVVQQILLSKDFSYESIHK